MPGGKYTDDGLPVFGGGTDVAVDDGLPIFGQEETAVAEQPAISPSKDLLGRGTGESKLIGLGLPVFNDNVPATAPDITKQIKRDGGEGYFDSFRVAPQAREGSLIGDFSGQVAMPVSGTTVGVKGKIQSQKDAEFGEVQKAMGGDISMRPQVDDKEVSDAREGIVSAAYNDPSLRSVTKVQENGDLLLDPEEFNKWFADYQKKSGLDYLNANDKIYIKNKIFQSVAEEKTQEKILNTVKQKYAAEGKVDPITATDFVNQLMPDVEMQVANSIGKELKAFGEDLNQKVQSGKLTAEQASKKYDDYYNLQSATLYPKLIKERADKLAEHYGLTDEARKEFNKLYQEEAAKKASDENMGAYQFWKSMPVGQGVAAGLTKGMGDVVKMAGDALMMNGYEDAGMIISQTAKSQNLPDVQLPEFSPESVTDPVWWETRAISTLPLMAEMIVPSLMSGGAAGTMAASLGISGGARLAAAGTTAGITNRYVESVMEGADQYGGDIEKGLAPEIASRHAADVVKKNMNLVGLDALQYAMLFAKIPAPLKIAFETGTEYGEEVYQGWAQAVQENPNLPFLKYAGSPEGIESGSLGGIMGMAFGGAGALATQKQGSKYQKASVVYDMLDRVGYGDQKRGLQMIATLDDMYRTGMMKEKDYKEALAITESVLKSRESLPEDLSEKARKAVVLYAFQVQDLKSQKAAAPEEMAEVFDQKIAAIPKPKIDPETQKLVGEVTADIEADIKAQGLKLREQVGLPLAPPAMENTESLIQSDIPNPQTKEGTLKQQQEMSGGVTSDVPVEKIDTSIPKPESTIYSGQPFGKLETELPGTKPSITGEVVGQHEGIDLVSVKDPKVFSDALATAAANRPANGTSVEQKTPQNFQEIVDDGGTLFLSADGDFGAAVEANGYIGSLFRNPKSKVKGIMPTLLKAAVDRGGKFFDAYSGKLEEMYIENGFRPVARLKFNEEFAPEGWQNSTLKNKPDVVFFVHDPEVKGNMGEGQYFDSIEEAYTFADNLSTELRDEKPTNSSTEKADTGEKSLEGQHLPDTKEKSGRQPGRSKYHAALPESKRSWAEQTVKAFTDKFRSVFGIPESVETDAIVDKKYSAKIRDAYEALPDDDSNNPEVKKAYEALDKEVEAQYEFLTNELGIEIEFVTEDPYTSSAEMIRDVYDNKHLRVYKGGENHIFLGERTADKNGITSNDKFRAVHDFFGHAVEGNEFGIFGEERAWVAHSKMFSPEAQKAMTTETRGQNSWVNNNPANEAVAKKFAEGNRLIAEGKIKEGQKLINEGKREFQYAVQKVALLPDEFTDWSKYKKEQSPKPTISKKETVEEPVRNESLPTDKQEAKKEALINAINDYNTIPNSHGVKKSAALKKINSLASELGVTIEKKPNAPRNKAQLVPIQKSGKQLVRTKSKTDAEGKRLEDRSNETQDLYHRLKNFIISDKESHDVNDEKLDTGLSQTEINKAVKNIDAGKYSSAEVTLLDALDEMAQSKMVRFTQGSGANVNKTGYSFEEFFNNESSLEEQLSPEELDAVLNMTVDIQDDGAITIDPEDIDILLKNYPNLAEEEHENENKRFAASTEETSDAGSIASGKEQTDISKHPDVIEHKRRISEAEKSVESAHTALDDKNKEISDKQKELAAPKQDSMFKDMAKRDELFAVDEDPLFKLNKQKADLEGTLAKSERELAELKKDLPKVEEFASKQGDLITGKSFAQSAKELADKIRSLKGKPLNLKDKDGNPITVNTASFFDAAIDITAAIIERGGKIADAIVSGLQHLRQQEWFKKLSRADRKAVIDEFKAMFAPYQEAFIKGKSTSTKSGIDSTTGVTNKRETIEVNPKAALKDQLRLEARAALAGKREGKEEGIVIGVDHGFRQGVRSMKQQQKDFATAIKKFMESQDIRGKLLPVQIRVITERAAKGVTSQAQLDNFLDYAERVIDNANYYQELSDIRTMQAAARRINHVSFKDAVREFTKINPDLIPLDKFTAYKQALDALTGRVPNYTLLQQMYFEITGLKQKSQYDNLVTFEAANEAYDSIWDNDIADVEDYRALLSDISDLKRKLNEMVNHGDITEADYAAIMERIGNDQKEVEQKFKSEIDILKGDLITEVRDKTITVPTSVTPEERKLINDFNALTNADLRSLQPEQLFVLSEVIDNINDGYIDVFRLNDIINSAEARGRRATQLAQQINESPSLTTSNTKAIDKLAKQEAAFWEGLLGLGRSTVGAFHKFVVSPFQKATGNYAFDIKEGYQAFDKFKKAHRVDRQGMNKLGMIATYMQEHMAQFNPKWKGTDKIGTRDWFGTILKDPREKAKYDQTKPTLSQKLKQAVGIKDLTQLQMIEKVWNELPKDADGNVDVKRVFESVSTRDGLVLKPAEQQMFDEVMAWKDQNLKSKQRAANEMKGLPFVEEPYHMLRIRLGDRAQIKPSGEISDSGAVRIKAGTGQERTSQKIEAVETDFEKMFVKGLEQTARDYHFTSTLDLINKTMSAAVEDVKQENKSILDVAKSNLAEALSFEFDRNQSGSADRALNTLLAARAAQTLLDPIRAFGVELPASFISMPLRGRTFSGYKDLVDFSGEFSDLLSYTESPLRLRENISKSIDLDQGEIKNATWAEKAQIWLSGMPERTMMKSVWLPTFRDAFEDITGQQFNKQRFKNDQVYREQYAREIKEAGSVADAQTEKIIGTTTKGGQRRVIELPFGLSQQKDTTVGKIIGFFGNYPYREFNELANGFREASERLHDGQGISSLSSLSKPFSVISNVMVYGYLGAMAYALKAISFGSDDEKEKGKEMIDTMLTPKGFLNELGANMTSVAASKYGVAGRAMVQLAATLAYENTEDKEAKKMIKNWLKSSMYMDTLPISETGKSRPGDVANAYAKYIPPLAILINRTVDAVGGITAIKKLYQQYSEKGWDGMSKDEQAKISMVEIMLKSATLIANLNGTSLPMQSTLEMAVRGMKPPTDSQIKTDAAADMYHQYEHLDRMRLDATIAQLSNGEQDSKKIDAIKAMRNIAEKKQQGSYSPEEEKISKMGVENKEVLHYLSPKVKAMSGEERQKYVYDLYEKYIISEATVRKLMYVP